MSDDLAVYVYRRLACAIVERAVRDAKSANPALAVEARSWLASDAVDILDALNILPSRVRRWVGGLEPVAQLSLEL